MPLEAYLNQLREVWGKSPPAVCRYLLCCEWTKGHVDVRAGGTPAAASLLFGEVCLHLLLFSPSTGGEVSLNSATSWIHSAVSKHSVLSQAGGSGWESSLLVSPRRLQRKGLAVSTLCRNMRKRNTPDVWKSESFFFFVGGGHLPLGGFQTN